jgi:hypothetical protein
MNDRYASQNDKARRMNDRYASPSDKARRINDRYASPNGKVNKLYRSYASLSGLFDMLFPAEAVPEVPAGDFIGPEENRRQATGCRLREEGLGPWTLGFSVRSVCWASPKAESLL